MDIYIITGASKGIGEALSRKVLDPGHIVFCIARTRNEELLELARTKNAPCTFLEHDLSKTDSLESLLDGIITSFPTDVNSVTLINNAGVVEPIGNSENNTPQDIAISVAINLTAPMILTSVFIRKLMTYKIAKRVMNISSGAGRNAYPGWSAYCAGKAGLDHYSRTIFEEQKNISHGVKVISIAPGIIDTGMQQTIRSTNEEDFKLVQRFINYKENGLLSSPDETAQKLIQLLYKEDIWENNPILDLRNL